MEKHYYNINTAVKGFRLSRSIHSVDLQILNPNAAQSHTAFHIHRLRFPNMFNNFRTLESAKVKAWCCDVKKIRFNPTFNFLRAVSFASAVYRPKAEQMGDFPPKQSQYPSPFVVGFARCKLSF